MLFDAVYVVGGTEAPSLASESDAVEFVKDAFKHCKTVVATGEGVHLLEAAAIPTGKAADAATIVGPRMTRAMAKAVVDAMAGHRLWAREDRLHLPL